jgi:hypothetical protein
MCSADEPKHSSGRPLPAMPAISKPVMFDTPEADKVLTALQVFPADNPWNADVSKWPVHPNSKKIIASIGPEKPFRYDLDMGFILVPPDQRRIDLKVLAYPDESDKGPFPIPDEMPIEGWPANYKRNPKLKNLTLDCFMSSIRPRKPTLDGPPPSRRSSI